MLAVAFFWIYAELMKLQPAHGHQQRRPLHIRLLALACALLVLSVSSCGRSAPVQHIHHCGFIDETGRFKIDLPSTHQQREFSEGLAAVEIHDKWGYIDTTGKFVIEPQFGDAGKFSDGLAVVTSVPSKELWAKTTLFGYINKTGKYVIPPQFNWAGPFSEGLAAVCVGPCRGQDHMKGTVSYIDLGGKTVLKPNFRQMRPFSEGLSVVCPLPCDKILSPVGFIDRTGRLVIPAKFTSADPFSEGLAAIQDVGFVDHSGAIKFYAKPIVGFIDHSGTVKLNVRPIHGFVNGIATIVGEKGVSFINAEGKVMVSTDHQRVEMFSDSGLAAACHANCEVSGEEPKWGYLNRKGEFVIQPTFRWVGRFSDGLAPACALVSSEGK